jgi:murein lipoprotein
MENSMTLSLTKVAPAVLLLAGSLGLGGCATKGFVREQVAVVDQRVTALEGRLQATDGTAKAALGEAQNNTQRIDQLNARVDGVEQRLQQRRPRN